MFLFWQILWIAIAIFAFVAGNQTAFFGALIVSNIYIAAAMIVKQLEK